MGNLCTKGTRKIIIFAHIVDEWVQKVKKSAYIVYEQSLMLLDLKVVFLKELFFTSSRLRDIMGGGRYWKVGVQ